jgi:hypothetical protein
MEPATTIRDLPNIKLSTKSSPKQQEILPVLPAYQKKLFDRVMNPTRSMKISSQRPSLRGTSLMGLSNIKEMRGRY